MAKTATAKALPASKSIDARIEQLGGWRGEALAAIRKIIKQACPGVVETVKWRKPSNPLGVPVWECDGIICTGESYKSAVKLTFAHGARLKDPGKLFNASLDGNLRRAIDIQEGDEIDAAALKALIREAAAFNTAKAATKAKPKAKTKAKKESKT